MSLRAILEAREACWRRQTALAARFGRSVLSLSLNVPGPDKNPPGAGAALDALCAALLQSLAAHAGRTRPLHDEALRGAAGPHRLLVVALPPLALKRLAVRLEDEHPGGRLADADVLAADGRPVSRRDLGLAPRRCFLCGEVAALCRAAGRHGAEDIAAHAFVLIGRAARAGGT